MFNLYTWQHLFLFSSCWAIRKQLVSLRTIEYIMSNKAVIFFLLIIQVNLLKSKPITDVLFFLFYGFVIKPISVEGTVFPKAPMYVYICLRLNSNWISLLFFIYFDMSDIEEYQPLFGQNKSKRSTLQKYGYYIATGIVLFTASLFLGHFVYESEYLSFIIRVNHSSRRWLSYYYA